MENRKSYSAPELEVILFAEEDVISDSLSSHDDLLPPIIK